jgi:carboxypeptidase family protein
MNRLIRLVILGTFTVSAMWAQATAQIHGVVQDMSGAGVPGASVKATQTETGISRTVMSEADGGYLLTNLPIGPYTVEVTKDGFTTGVQSGVVLQVNSDPAIRVVLRVGAVSERVTVEANATQVETRSAGVGTVIETQRVLDLPLNGRQATDLVTISGLAVQTGQAPGYTMNTGVNISVAGGMSYSVQYNLDGATHLDTYVGTNMPLPFPDALQEFRLVTSTQDASSGGHSGAAVNAVTKSGTNSFHGDVFEFLRNGNLNGRDFFAKTDDKLKRNQFGGVIGGPIRKDKLFFFAGYQGTLTRQTPTDQVEFVPTAAMQAGDFGAWLAAGCGTLRPGVADSSGHLRAPLSPAALYIAKRLPQTSNPCGQVITGAPLHQDQLQVPVRVDYQLSDKHSLFGRYLATRIDTTVPYTLAPNDILTTGGSGNTQPVGIGTDDLGQSISLGDTYLISPTTVNSFRAYLNRVGANTPGAKFFGVKEAGINAFSYLPNWVTVSVQGAFTIGGGNFTANSIDTVTTFGINEDVNMVRGSHQISFGVNAMRSLLNAVSNAWSMGFYTVNATTTGAALADFMTGNVAQLRQANPNPENLTQNFFGLYAQDTWKLTPRLTLTYGLRWNPFFPMSFKQGDLYNFSISRFYANQVSQVIKNAPPGFTYPGDPGFQGKAGMDRKWGNLEPRIGIAFDPFGDGKTAIRLGGGIAYDFIRQDLHENTSSVAPFRLTVIRTGITLDNPWNGYPGGNPFPYSYNPANPVFPAGIPYGSYLPIPPDLKTTKQYTWNFGIQRQFTPNVFASATYVGTKLDHVWNAVELNPAQFISGNCAAGQYGLTAAGPCSNSGNVNQRRLLTLSNPATSGALGFLTQYDDGGTQNYNGLLLSASWRMGRNFNLNGNYTWSHCIGLPVITLLNPGANYVHGPNQNNGPVNRNLDVGNCGAAATGGNAGAQDRRHIANITLVAQTPKFSNPAARWLGSDWTLASIVQARSGQALSILTGLDNALSGFFGNTGTQRPNQVLADINAPNQGQACSPAPCVSWWNAGAFTQPFSGTYGNMGSNNVFGPGYWEWDEAVSRQFQIREGQRLEIRAEAFNVTNSVRFASPGLSLANTATFGKVTGSAGGVNGNTGGGPRVMQFALKYMF